LYHHSSQLLIWVKEESFGSIILNQKLVYAVKIHCTPKFPFSAPICNKFSQIICPNPRTSPKKIVFWVYSRHGKKSVTYYLALVK
jgi:hypothetical protein